MTITCGNRDLSRGGGHISQAIQHLQALYLPEWSTTAIDSGGIDALADAD